MTTGQNLLTWQQQQKHKNTGMCWFYTAEWELVTSTDKLGVVSTCFSGGKKKLNLYNPQWFVIMLPNSSANVVSSQNSMLFYGFFNTFTVFSSNILLQCNILTSGTELCKENYVSLKSVL